MKAWYHMPRGTSTRIHGLSFPGLPLADVYTTIGSVSPEKKTRYSQLAKFLGGAHAPPTVSQHDHLISV